MKTFLVRFYGHTVPLFMACLASALARAGDDWPQWRGVNRDGAADSSPPLLDALPPEGPPLLWEHPLPPFNDKWIYYGSPVIADGRAYLRLTVRPLPPAAKADVVVCAAMTDGRPVWRFEQPGGDANYGAPNTPCIAGGRIYFAGSQAKVFCLDAADGKECWATQLEGKGGVFSSSALLASGHLVVADTKLVALDAKTGVKAWENAGIRAEHNSPAVWIHQGKAYIIATHVPKAKKGAGTAEKPKTLCVDAGTGTVVWELAAGGEFASPTVGGDLLALLYGALGLKVYRMSTNGATEIGSVDHLDAGSCTPAIHEGCVYGFVNKEGGFRYDTTRRDFTWRNKASGPSSSPIVAGGKVIMLVGGASVALGLFDAANGKSLIAPKCRPPAAVRCSSPALSGGRLVFNAGTHLRCYDLRKSGAKGG